MSETVIVPFNTGKVEGLLVKIQDGYNDDNMVVRYSLGLYLECFRKDNDNITIKLPSESLDDSYQILGLSKDLTEEQCREIVDWREKGFSAKAIFWTLMIGLRCFEKKPLNYSSMELRTGNWLVLVKQT